MASEYSPTTRFSLVCFIWTQ